MRKLLVVAVAAGLMVGLVASPVSAAKPEVVLDEVFENEAPILFDDATDACGFDVYLAETVSVKITEYFDNDGNFIRTEEKIRGTSYWSSDEKELKAEHWAWNGSFNEEAFTFTQRGNIWNIHANGPVLTDSGRVVFDAETGEVIFGAGQFPQGLDGFGALCEALS